MRLNPVMSAERWRMLASLADKSPRSNVNARPSRAAAAAERLSAVSLITFCLTPACSRCRGIIRNDTIYDKLVFQKVRNILGGRVKSMITSSAPLSHEVMEFFKVSRRRPVPPRQHSGSRAGRIGRRRVVLHNLQVIYICIYIYL